MEKSKNNRLRILALALAAVLTLGALTVLLVPSASAATVSKYSYTGTKPYFNEYRDSTYHLNNDASLDRWFDTLPKNTNTNPFCGYGRTTYEGINGKTVYADAFYRKVGDSLNDPNYAEGLLLYDCIQYKVAHPEEDVSIYFSTYRFSVTASVCVDPESKFYGYMRSQFNTEYDDFGFIRLSFMLVEAARMGIHVTLVTQLDSYAANQYSSTTSKGYAPRAIVSHKNYFNDALKKSCYSQYASGKKVSDFMTFAPVSWNVTERGEDMHHIKCLLVSHYLDQDGTEYAPAVFVTSSNLDENDYLGRNNNKGAQSGAIISNHDDLYRVTANYLDTIVKYQDSNQISLFRDEVRKKQTGQIDLIRAGRGSEIAPEEQLVYLGSDTDDVFEMYFTPLPGSVMVWDTYYNPYCRTLSAMLKSEGPITFTWNMPYNEVVNYFEYTFEDVICEMFHKNQNPENRLYMHFESFDANKYNDLTVGKNIGFKKVNTNLSTYIHSKDMLVSYEEGGEQKYVSIVCSCNFGAAAFWYRSNSAMVIKETEANHNFWTTLGKVSTEGAIQ